MGTLSEEVQSFIREHIKTVAALDILLLMHRTSGRGWEAQEIASDLRTNVPTVIAFLEDFLQKGLVRKSAGSRYEYHPSDPTLDSAISALSRDYSTRPVTVVNAIYASPDDKIQTFADAFKFKKG